METASTSFTNPQIPQFNGKNYDYWAITMKALFSSQDIWDLVENGFQEPTDEATYNALSQQEKDVLRGNKKKDSKALFYIFQAVHESIFPRVAAATKSNQAWDILQTAYQGMAKVKTSKLQMLRRYFETLFMKESTNIDSFLTHVSGLVTQIKSHGETLEERGIVEKVLRSLPTRFEAIVVAIEETKDLSLFLVDEPNASLISHEHRLNRAANSSLEHAFKTQVSFGQGQGRGRSYVKRRGISPHRGGRSNPSSSNGRGNNQNPRQGPSQNQAQGQREHGIHKKFTIRYTPQQNGVGEKKNRTLLETARSMLKAKHLPNDYWAKVVACAAYILNRCPTKSIQNIVLEEAWSGRKHSVTHMRVFGCVASAHVPDELRKKLDNKGEKCIFVGYSDESKAYKLYNPLTKKVIISKDV
eukprot:PITA_19205